MLRGCHSSAIFRGQTGGLGRHEVQGRHPTVRVTQGQVGAGLSQFTQGPGFPHPLIGRSKPQFFAAIWV